MRSIYRINQQHRYGIMLGFASLVIGRVIAGEFKKLNLGTVIIAVVLVAFYAFNLAI